jgi:arylsulfatase A-like enzyme
MTTERIHKMNHLNRREFLILTAGGAAASLVSLAGCNDSLLGKSKLKPKHPNIIYIMADDLGYGDLGCYGQGKIKTPNLDKMADEGMRFTQHYSGSTVCAPSRCVLMTGMHTGHCTIRGNGPGLLREDDVTIADLLKKAGYVTGIIGKWGVGEPPPPGDPKNNGFDYFFGYLSMIHAHNYYPEFLWENDKKIELKNIVQYTQEGYAKGVGGVSTNKIQYSHDIFTKKALEFIETNKQKTFFLYLPYTIPHTNNQAGKNGMEVPDLDIYKDKPWPEQEKAKAAMITRMDADIGKIFDLLKQLGIEKNTLVMFSSDNGPHKESGIDPNFFNSNGPLRGIKRDLYEGGIRVPLIARWPGKIKANSVSDHISAFWDFLPSCAETAGLLPPPDTDGISYLPTLLGQPEKQKKHKYLYWEFHERGGKQAVRMGKWKAVRLNTHQNPDAPIELYNLDEDLAEQQNIAAQNPGIVAKMETLMHTAHRDPKK